MMGIDLEKLVAVDVKTSDVPAKQQLTLADNAEALAE